MYNQHQSGARAVVGLTFAAAMVLSACGSDSVLDAQFEPEVANVVDNFQFQATGVARINETLSYTWQNNGTRANINQSGVITGGTATLEVRDAAGTVVYSGNLASTGTFTSSAGTAGAWKVKLVLNDVSGTLNFRLQKP